MSILFNSFIIVDTMWMDVIEISFTIFGVINAFYVLFQKVHSFCVRHSSESHQLSSITVDWTVSQGM